jgi:hypothetical protein
VIYALYDFDRAGQDAANALRRQLERFAEEKGVEVRFHLLGVTLDQIEELALPTRKPKRKTAADKRWPHEFACELDAIPADELRRMVDEAITRHLPQDQLRVLKIVEESERELIEAYARDSVDDEDDDADEETVE